MCHALPRVPTSSTLTTTLSLWLPFLATCTRHPAAGKWDDLTLKEIVSVIKLAVEPLQVTIDMVRGETDGRIYLAVVNTVCACACACVFA
jgi:hypothetical protein